MRSFQMLFFYFQNTIFAYGLTLSEGRKGLLQRLTFEAKSLFSIPYQQLSLISMVFGIRSESLELGRNSQFLPSFRSSSACSSSQSRLNCIPSSLRYRQWLRWQNSGGGSFFSELYTLCPDLTVLSLLLILQTCSSAILRLISYSLLPLQRMGVMILAFLRISSSWAFMRYFTPMLFLELALAPSMSMVLRLRRQFMSLASVFSRGYFSGLESSCSWLMLERTAISVKCFLAEGWKYQTPCGISEGKSGCFRFTNAFEGMQPCWAQGLARQQVLQVQLISLPFTSTDIQFYYASHPTLDLTLYSSITHRNIMKEYAQKKGILVITVIRMGNRCMDLLIITENDQESIQASRILMYLEYSQSISLSRTTDQSYLLIFFSSFIFFIMLDSYADDFQFSFSNTSFGFWQARFNCSIQSPTGLRFIFTQVKQFLQAGFKTGKEAELVIFDLLQELFRRSRSFYFRDFRQSLPNFLPSTFQTIERCLLLILRLCPLGISWSKLDFQMLLLLFIRVSSSLSMLSDFFLIMITLFTFSQNYFILFLFERYYCFFYLSSLLKALKDSRFYSCCQLSLSLSLFLRYSSFFFKIYSYFLECCSMSLA